jgi:hypothetical protein
MVDAAAVVTGIAVRTCRAPGTAMAIVSYACSINQRGSNLTFSNEQGVTAQGKYLGNKNVTANWNGQTINGTLVKNGGQISWDNGTIRGR